jgi:hypothetical protein
LEAENLASLAQKCYDMRGDAVGRINVESKHSNDDFGELAHYIGRMGATRKAAFEVVSSMVHVPALSSISSIQVAEKPEKRTLTVNLESPYELIRDICRQSPNLMDAKKALYAFVDLDMRLDNNARFKLMASGESVATKIHCELQLLGIFSSNGWKFLYDDKYIGCSKPACYFCYNWISAHKDCYVLPSTHNKVIPGCRGPDHLGGPDLKATYQKFRSKIDQDILVILLENHDERGMLRHQHQSTDGSSSRAASQFSTRIVLESGA